MSTKLLTSCHIISPDFEAFDAAVLIDGDTIKVVIENAWKEFGLDKHDKEAK